MHLIMIIVIGHKESRDVELAALACGVLSISKNMPLILNADFPSSEKNYDRFLYQTTNWY